MTASRRFEALAFAGPARSSKTEGLIVNPLVHAMIAAPRLVSVFHMTQASAREWVLQELQPMIRNTPALFDRLSGRRGDDNIFDKRFIAGGRITIDWPVRNKLAARSIPLVLMTDYDAMPQNVEGEGTPFALGRKRTQAHGTRGMIAVESSPRFPILDESWSPATSHEAPPCGGVLGIYNSGTRARYYWPCPHCGEEFEPTFDRLEYPKQGDPAARGAAAVMVCLHCGGVIDHSRKAELNAAGRWLHESADGRPVPIDAADLRETKTLSYWLQGPAAAFASWSQIVTRYLEAEAHFEATGDDGELITALNVELGLPYLPRGVGDGSQLSAAALKEARTDHGWNVAPAQTRFLTAAVDVQGGRFVVQVEAWLPHMERVIIDRFDLHTPPPGAPMAGTRALDPGRYAEDWEVLTGLAAKSYPVAGADHRLRLLSIVIDCGGAPGVTPNAYEFWRKRQKTHVRRFHLVRGKGGDQVKRAEVRTPETSHRGKAEAARDVRIIWAGSDRLKNEIAASLTREGDGARALHIPKGAPAEICDEFAAERRNAKGKWEARPGVKRNEALDLAVYSLALAIVFGVEALNWDAAPPWARQGPDNPFAIRPKSPADGDQAAPGAVIAETAAKPTTAHSGASQAKPARRPRPAKRPKPALDGWSSHL